MTRNRVVIVGGGLIGLSIARALTERGVSDVLVLERHSLASGGTGKSSGIVRAHYGVPSIAAMAWRSLPLIEKLGDVVGFRQTGYTVIVGEENEAALRANIATHQSLGIEAEMLAVDELAALWPMMNVEDVAAAAIERRGGYADASQLALYFGQVARDKGARVRQHTPVARVLTEGEKVTGVELEGGEVVEADTVILAAGWWSARLLAGLGIDFPVEGYRSELLVVDAGVPLADLPVVSDLVSLQYCRIEGSGQFLVGNSDHDDPENRYVDPDDYSNIASEAGIEKYAEKVMHRFPGFPDPSVTHSYAGVYDVPPDWNPVIAPVGPEGLVLCAGFAGHGFKISPAVGDLVADLVLEGDSTDPDVPARDFRLERFAEGDLLRSPHPYVGAGEMR
ncbi:NAD(P)/FAD-dependent oxidoreductase [Nocardioides daeguensis]|uniref:FAD-binding oxidoreductase n=1 Tax=Nocardioides daeguensis TaxID=908359 RepID=A0ABP6VKX4_9ACTN|nr:FAD-dependent oxidoreductase [Nocardioides daeguensis]MBV6729006.1 FAD-binding oxidoreductase [Nocardioides daeguensis]MCR1773527.1 FAD-binding oxidoreductase [Nocardioides daeguensis]